MRVSGGARFWHAARRSPRLRALHRPLPVAAIRLHCPEGSAVIARHRPKSVFKPADVERVRERFQTILRNVSQKPLVEVKPPVAAPARKAPTPPPAVRRKRA
jgi:hypothetical protein